MKRLISLLGLFLTYNCFSQQATFSHKSFGYNLSFLKLSHTWGNNGIGPELDGSVSPTVLYSINGVEHLITNPSDTIPTPPLHFINKNGIWIFENWYPDGAMDGPARNRSFMDTLGTIAHANPGNESQQPWPFGDIFISKTKGEKLLWQKISIGKSFYHDVATGDLNGDGLVDVAAVHMGTRATLPNQQGWGDDPHFYFQDAIDSYSPKVSYLGMDGFTSDKIGLGALFIGHLYGNKIPEIVLGEYGFSPNNSWAKETDRKGLSIFKYDSVQKRHIYYKSPIDKGVYANHDRGTSSIKAFDFDNDGDIDLVAATEGSDYNGIQIWENIGNGDFKSGQNIEYTFGKMQFREFEIIDVNKDGWKDIILNPFHYGSDFRIFNNNSSNNMGAGIKLQNLILINDKGTFKPITSDLSFLNARIGFLRSGFVNGKLKFIGFESYASANSTSQMKDSFLLHEFIVNFCTNLTKPTFNTTKYSLCSGDSLKLTVTNINKGDSLKWYYGTKSDLTNLSNKTFTDSTKLFVTRTDSLGCIISSDTVQIKKYGIPSAPILSRDTANFLLSGATGTTWYKDGNAITDTTQKYKPATPGSYTAKTTTNGCTSVISAAYYYLVTDIINLSKDEFIKLAPNPFINQLNFDFIVKGYQRLNLEVFDIATGTKVASQPNLTAGSKITLGQLSAGTYVIRVTSNDNKISYQFKMVKL